MFAKYSPKSLDENQFLPNKSQTAPNSQPSQAITDKVYHEGNMQTGA